MQLLQTRSSALALRARAGQVQAPLSARLTALPLRRASLIAQDSKGMVPMPATSDDEGANIAGEYCAIDQGGKRVKDRTVGEMEADFLEALTAYYYDGKPKISDEEFELLKEELVWNGSKIAVLDSDELRFLEASIAANKGQPVMSDSDYDALKARLKSKGSTVAAEGPRCSIRSKKMYSDATTDYIRMTLLNLPAALLVLGFIFAIDDVTGFEITEIVKIPAPFNTIALWAGALPITFALATAITNFGFRDHLILKGPCPNCGTENITYFGEVFTVASNQGVNAVDCPGCSAGLTFDELKRTITVTATPEEKKAQAAAVAAKKAASAKKKAAKAAAEA